MAEISIVTVRILRYGGPSIFVFFVFRWKRIVNRMCGFLLKGAEREFPLETGYMGMNCFCLCFIFCVLCVFLALR